MASSLPILRVGLGTDLHRLAPGRKLMLAGVEIPSPVGAVAHSDGDVVLHALVDALLGAMGGGDIGELFPDTDPRWKDADSTLFLSAALEKVKAAGFAVGNVDAVIHCQEPRLTAHKPLMRQRLAELLDIPTDRCNLKAKTGEKMDAIGEGKAIACTLVVGLVENTSKSQKVKTSKRQNRRIR